MYYVLQQYNGQAIVRIWKPQVHHDMFYCQIKLPLKHNAAVAKHKTLMHCRKNTPSLSHRLSFTLQAKDQ